MKRIIIVALLAIASSGWIASKAICVARAPQATQQGETISGILVEAAMPCHEDPCPPCLTLALNVDSTLYYLTSDSDSIMARLDEIEGQFEPNTPAVITGIIYESAGDLYINVQKIELDGDHLPIENVIPHTPAASKILRNNQILIQRGEDTYTLTGQKVE